MDHALGQLLIVKKTVIDTTLKIFISIKQMVLPSKIVKNMIKNSFRSSKKIIVQRYVNSLPMNTLNLKVN